MLKNGFQIHTIIWYHNNLFYYTFTKIVLLYMLLITYFIILLTLSIGMRTPFKSGRGISCILHQQTHDWYTLIAFFRLLPFYTYVLLLLWEYPPVSRPRVVVYCSENWHITYYYYLVVYCIIVYNIITLFYLCSIGNRMWFYNLYWPFYFRSFQSKT